MANARITLKRAQNLQSSYPELVIPRLLPDTPQETPVRQIQLDAYHAISDASGEHARDHHADLIHEASLTWAQYALLTR